MDGPLVLHNKVAGDGEVLSLFTDVARAQQPTMNLKSNETPRSKVGALVISEVPRQNPTNTLWLQVIGDRSYSHHETTSEIGDYPCCDSYDLVPEKKAVDA